MSVLYFFEFAINTILFIMLILICIYIFFSKKDSKSNNKLKKDFEYNKYNNLENKKYINNDLEQEDDDPIKRF